METEEGGRGERRSGWGSGKGEWEVAEGEDGGIEWGHLLRTWMMAKAVEGGAQAATVLLVQRVYKGRNGGCGPGPCSTLHGEARVASHETS